MSYCIKKRRGRKRWDDDNKGRGGLQREWRGSPRRSHCHRGMMGWEAIEGVPSPAHSKAQRQVTLLNSRDQAHCEGSTFAVHTAVTNQPSVPKHSERGWPYAEVRSGCKLAPVSNNWLWKPECKMIPHTCSHWSHIETIKLQVGLINSRGQTDLACFFYFFLFKKKKNVTWNIEMCFA